MATCQIRPSSGLSFWASSALGGLARLPGEDFRFTAPDRFKVSFQGRIWVLKQKSLTLGEIASYQIAEALSLPVRPWLAYYGDLTDQSDEPGIGRSWKNRALSTTGLLVEWFEAQWQFPPAHEEFVDKRLLGLGLVLQALDGHETAGWLTNASQSERYLCDLEFIGPHLDRAKDEWYQQASPAAIGDAMSDAERFGSLEHFEAGARRLLALDLKAVLDFSGHPRGNAYRRRALAGLNARLQALAIFIS